CVFFFQAEDGIRDPLVTGVQTCALPICLSRQAARRRPVEGRETPPRDRVESPRGEPSLGLPLACALSWPRAMRESARCRRWACKIGRASCRERVWVAVGGLA